MACSGTVLYMSKASADAKGLEMDSCWSINDWVLLLKIRHLCLFTSSEGAKTYDTYEMHALHVVHCALDRDRNRQVEL